MNFNDIQSAWNNEETPNIPIPQSFKGVQTPLKQLRTTMKAESITFIIMTIAMGFAPQVLSLGNTFLLPFYTIYAFHALIATYYFIRFYFFYNRLNYHTLNTKDALYTLYYDIKLNIEMYRSFNYALIPVMVIIFALFLADLQPDIHGSVSHLITIGLFLLIISTAMVYGGVELWLRYGYSKYLCDIGHILKEFKE
jgi:hypothetical protein